MYNAWHKGYMVCGYDIGHTYTGKTWNATLESMFDLTNIEVGA